MSNKNLPDFPKNNTSIALASLNAIYSEHTLSIDKPYYVTWTFVDANGDIGKNGDIMLISTLAVKGLGKWNSLKFWGLPQITNKTYNKLLLISDDLTNWKSAAIISNIEEIPLPNDKGEGGLIFLQEYFNKTPYYPQIRKIDTISIPIDNTLKIKNTYILSLIITGIISLIIIGICVYILAT